MNFASFGAAVAARVAELTRDSAELAALESAA